MKKCLFTVISFLLAYNFFRPNIFASDNSLILESSQEPSIYSGHHSHCSHASHASHYSSHSVNNADSIQSLSPENFISLKKLLRDNQDIDVYRSFIAEAIITSIHNNTDDAKSSKTLVIIGRDLSCDSNIWIYVTLTQTPMTYSWSSNGVNSIRSNKISELYRNCPPSAHQYSLSDEILSFINSSIKPIIQ